MNNEQNRTNEPTDERTPNVFEKRLKRNQISNQMEISLLLLFAANANRNPIDG